MNNPSPAAPSITIDDIRAAADRLAPHVARTPLLQHDGLDDRVGGRLWLKAECLQRTGSFKIRGALNRILQLTPQERAAGVVAFSSGNHAQGVAAAAGIAGIAATIVMPSDAPAVKAARTRDLGAQIVPYNRQTEDREEIAARIAAERGAVLVPPFDDPAIMAGQGTAGLEIVDDLDARGEEIDQALICCSGGGLASGIGTALRSRWPHLDIVVVEPAGYDDMTLSLAAGTRLSIEPPYPSVCDALLLPIPGQATFATLTALGARGVTVTDDEAMAAVRTAAAELRVVVEPGGAVALAAALTGKVPTTGRRAVAILSGGNIDLALLREALA